MRERERVDSSYDARYGRQPIGPSLPVSECELKVGLEDWLLEFALILNCDESSTMSAEASSPSDDTRETNTSKMDSYHTCTCTCTSRIHVVC